MKIVKFIVTSLMFFITCSAYAEDGVSRAVITSAIEEREPVDQLKELANDQTKVYFFTEIKGMKGHALTHRWQQGEKVQAEIKFEIGGDRWRVWSSKNLNESWLGEWTVSVIDAGENIITQQKFNYIEAAEPVTEKETEIKKSAETEVYPY